MDANDNPDQVKASMTGVPNSSYFAQAPAADESEPTITEPIFGIPLETVADDANDNQDGPHSSFENIIPLENLKHGFEVINDIIETTAQKVQEKANEVIQSEQFQAAKKKTEEIITPVWEQTKATAQVAAEKTNETLHQAAEQMRPHVQQMHRQISDATLSTWKFLSAAAMQAADYTSKMAADLTKGDDEEEGSAQDSSSNAASGNEFNSKPMNY